MLAAVVALAGCNGGSKQATTTTAAAPATTTSTAATTTTVALDTATMPLDGPLPPVIDLVYAQRTMDALAHLDLQAALEIRAARAETPRFLALVKAGNQEPALSGTLRYYSGELSEGFSDWQANPTQSKVSVARIVSQRTTSPACLILIATTDLSPIDKEFTNPQPSGVELTERARTLDPERLNETQFQIRSVGTAEEGDRATC